MFWGKLGHCPHCETPIAGLVLDGHLVADLTVQGGEDLSMLTYRCPDCNATIIAGKVHPLGVCFYEVKK